MCILKSRFHAAALVVMLASFGAGCRSAADADRPEIARLIQNSPEFKRAKTIRLAREAEERCDSALATVENWRRLLDLGIIETSAIEVWHGGAKASGCRADFSEAIRRDIGTNTPLMAADASGPNGNVAEIPVANRNFMRIVDVNRTETESAEVSFLWQWQPNVAGRRLGLSNRAVKGRATLWLYSHGWELARLDVTD